MHLGLIGGIGPSATAYYYRLLSEQGTELQLTISHASLKTLSGNVAAGNRREQAEVFADHIESLRRAGAETAAVTSIAGHFCLEELKAISSLPIISAVDSLESYFKRSGLSRIGVLGNAVSMKTHLFGMIESVDMVTPPPGELEAVGEAYMRMAAAGICTGRDRTLFFDAGRAMIDDGADGILLGGTDLFLAFQDGAAGFPVIDAAAIHVGDLLRAAMSS